jgi:replicative DNA helicase
MEHYDSVIEKNVLKGMLQLEDFLKVVILHNRVTEEHFLELFHKDVFNTIKMFYGKYGCAPTKEKFVQNLKITFTSKYKPQQQKKIWASASERLFAELGEKGKRQLESDVEILNEYCLARAIQSAIIEVSGKYEVGDYESVMDILRKLVAERNRMGNDITEGDVVSDHRQHIEIIRLKKSGKIVPIGTGIKGMRESDTGENNIVNLDDYLDGGWHPGELTLLIGENNVGKSFALMEFAYNAAKAKKPVVLFTIEMGKIKQQARIYSRMTGIAYSKFRTGELSEGDHKRWERCLEIWKEKCGTYYVVAFPKGAKVNDIENKMRDIQNNWGKKIGLVCIDYLNDMTPTGKYSSDKDWGAFGEISWDLANLCKYWNNNEGIPIVTANQRKTRGAGKGYIHWDDAAFSPLPSQHATIGIGISQGQDDLALGRILWNIFKNRDGEKGISFYIYPNFSRSRISSLKKMMEYYGEE